ncbi:hypothetical protein [Mycobacterium sp. AZCC_0083]|uniref:MmyB family transcriptional regulator n=1 Tax=Mycobacterium sp. AZCC_0083 TaxID=2735882 RepID=UPI0035CC951C
MARWRDRSEQPGTRDIPDGILTSAGPNHMRHPVVGEFHLWRSRFDMPDSDGQHLLVYHAEPGTEYAAKLASLQSSLTGGTHS